MKIIKNLKPEITQSLVVDLNNRLLNLAEVEGGVARGRKHLWLQAKPDYKTHKYKPAHQDLYLWEFIKREVYPEATLAQVYWANGRNGIAWHRDAAFAKPPARILNLGKVLLIGMNDNTDSGEFTALNLKGGEVIEFDCKCLHTAQPLENHRIGIAAWQDNIDINNEDNWL